ncbi:unnamed protein product [Spodoptera littoralis]|uniref:Uncharacterized protein n=1 Tax=Spodoptera littoralis TaxID=7109 RepID=A0A9P0I5L9_SPOLI|nr:unnamed protein product [Spodoptera littoralis]CAH1639824.1 unnamed protein product [Spodoptera littoralis]
MNKSTWKCILSAGSSKVFGFGLKMLEINIFRNVEPSDTAINEVLFYGAGDGDEKQVKQIAQNNLYCIRFIIVNASQTVDVCVPNLSSETLAKCLVTVHQNNKVKIRIAIHNSDDDDLENLQLFAKNGVEVKVLSPEVRLEHEFVLVDARAAGEAVAALGALDLEPDCLASDATLLTSEPSVLTALRREFERVWNSDSDVTRVRCD